MPSRRRSGRPLPVGEPSELARQPRVPGRKKVRSKLYRERDDCAKTTNSRIAFLKRGPSFTLLKQNQRFVANALSAGSLHSSTATIHTTHCRRGHARMPNAAIIELAIVRCTLRILHACIEHEDCSVASLISGRPLQRRDLPWIHERWHEASAQQSCCSC